MTDSREVLTRAGTPPQRTVAFGAPAHQVYDVYEPAGEPEAAACLILVHGGFWREAYDRAHLRPMAADLAARGYRVVLVEYRRTGMPGGRWPGPGLDVAAAVHVVRERETEPSTPVVLVGHSAGAQLVTWLLHQPAGREVAGAVALAGCLDLELVRRLGLGDGAVQELMDDIPPARRAVWEAADPASLGPTPAPVHVVHGNADETVPVQVSESWWRRCAVPGRDTMTVLDGAGHFALIDPRSDVFEVVTGAVETLVEA